MDDELRMAVRQLTDERDIRRVMMNYASGVDRRDWDQVRNCFLPTASVEGTRSKGPRDEYLAALIPGVEAFGVTMHTIGQQVIDLDGDRAHMVSYLTARHYADAAGTQESLTMGVRYLDDLERQPDGSWKIALRRVFQFWVRTGIVSQ